MTGDVPAEARRALENLRLVLVEAGFDFGDVVKTTLYMVDLAELAMVNEVYAEFVLPPYPARATVGVAALPRGHGWRSRQSRAAASAPSATPLRGLLDLSAAQTARTDEQPPYPAAYLGAHHL